MVRALAKLYRVETSSANRELKVAGLSRITPSISLSTFALSLLHS